ncbi:MAG: sigma-70 family RNA polymerase sigma factor [Alphaproteobacteria bacterium]|nr:sigma-70 family RNA polymerase sigma factor [Alphaproteobacteria bacterium]
MNDDATLLSAWASGDRAAGAQLIERHYDPVVRFFRNKATDHADDLVQRTLLTLAERASTFQGQGSVRAFVFGIARNVLYEHIRGRVRDGRNEPDFHSSALADIAPGVATQAAQRAEQQLLLEALRHVPVESQVLLELYYWEELSVGELAEVMDVPEGTIKSRLHRARGQLREAVEQVPATPEASRSAISLLDLHAEARGDTAGA